MTSAYVRYLGKKQAAEILLGGLARLEYRGYDSAGIAVVDGGKMTIKKKVKLLITRCAFTEIKQASNNSLFRSAK